MQKNDSEHIDMEEAFYLEFLASINKKEVLHLHYVEKQSPFLIAETLKLSTRFVARIIRENEEKI